jgi:hypothetical protein
MATNYFSSSLPVTLAEVQRSQQHTVLQPQSTSSTKGLMADIFCLSLYPIFLLLPLSEANILLHTPFSNTLILYYFLTIEDQVPHLHKDHTESFTSADSRQKDKRILHRRVASILQIWNVLNFFVNLILLVQLLSG